MDVLLKVLLHTIPIAMPRYKPLVLGEIELVRLHITYAIIYASRFVSSWTKTVVICLLCSLCGNFSGVRCSSAPLEGWTVCSTVTAI